MRTIILKVREQTGALRGALLAASAEGLASHLPALQEAAAALTRLQTESPDALLEQGSRRELEALAGELRSAGRLIARGLAFQRGWARLLSSASSSYRSDGEPALLQAPGSIWMRG